MIFILLNCQICIIMVILNVIYHVYIMISNNNSAERFLRRTVKEFEFFFKNRFLFKRLYLQFSILNLIRASKILYFLNTCKG